MSPTRRNTSVVLILSYPLFCLLSWFWCLLLLLLLLLLLWWWWWWWWPPSWLSGVLTHTWWDCQAEREAEKETSLTLGFMQISLESSAFQIAPAVSSIPNLCKKAVSGNTPRTPKSGTQRLPIQPFNQAYFGNGGRGISLCKFAITWLGVGKRMHKLPVFSAKHHHSGSVAVVPGR